MRRSIFTRIVWVAILLALAMAAALWFVTDRTIRSEIERSARDQVDTDLAGLVDIHATSGRDELIRRIGDRLAVVGVEANTPHYLLAGGDGRLLAGDMRGLPSLDPAQSEAGYIDLGKGVSAYARATQLEPDLQLVVAREADSGDDLLRRIAIAFLLAGAVAALLVALAGRYAAGRLGRRIEAVNRAFRARDADLLGTSERPVSGDEIDELAAHSAAAIARMEALMQAYRDTSDQLAHEIHTPLMHLDRQLARALESGPPTETAERLVASRGEIRRIVNMLESLLDIAASKARRGDFTRLEEIDFSALLRRVCELYADSAEETGHTFTWDIAPEVTVRGEMMHLMRMVTNLLDNAFKYVPAGGSVSLTLAAGPVLDIVDNGPGIPAGERNRIFDRFYKGANASRSKGGKGSGLGLALARAIAERHGLALELIHSGKGAHFRVAAEA